MTCKGTENLIRRVMVCIVLHISCAYFLAGIGYTIGSLLQGDVFYGLRSDVTVLQGLNITGLAVAFVACIAMLLLLGAWLAGAVSICKEEW